MSKLRILRPFSQSDLSFTKRFLSTTHRRNVQQAVQMANTQWSYVSGPTTNVPPLVELSLGETVAVSADLFGNREALVDVPTNQRRTFTQLHNQITSLAAGLIELGLKPGDRLGIWGPSTIEWYLTQFAAAKAGLVLVNINPAYQADELSYCINKVGISAIVCHDKFKTQDYFALIQSLNPAFITGNAKRSRVPTLKHVIMIPHTSDNSEMQRIPRTTCYTDIAESAGSEAYNRLHRLQVDNNSVANIQFTSGTTGQPKGVMLSHRSMVNNGLQLGHRLGYDSKEHRICLSVPLHHCFGNVAGTICGMIHGATCVIPAPSFSGAACVDAIQAENCTSLYGTPTMFIDILDNIRRNGTQIESLETGIMAGAPCPKELCKNVMSELGMSNICVAYGLTETSTAVTQGFTTDSIDLMTGTVGYPTNHIEISIMDEDQTVLPVGTPGELCSRGFNTMLGYWGDQEKTRETITEDGWVRSGDLAVMMPNGYVRIVGRIKDMIIRGGENIYPREIEEFLHTHPAVQEAQVFGVADERMGEEVAVWIRLNDGYTMDEKEVRAFCKGNLSHFKIPRYVEFVAHFPTTATGKIQKFQLKSMMETRLNLEAKMEEEKSKLSKC